MLTSCHRINYDGNHQENYDLYVDGKKAANMPVGEDAAIEITTAVQNIITKFEQMYPDAPIIVQNDSDDPPIGIIIDVGMDDDCLDSAQIWFIDYQS